MLLPSELINITVKYLTIKSQLTVSELNKNINNNLRITKINYPKLTICENCLKQKKFKNLKELVVDKIKYSDISKLNLNHLLNLSVLVLGNLNNEIIAKSIAKLVKLRILKAKIIGKMNFGNFTNLRELSVSNSEITNNDLLQLPHLTSISINACGEITNVNCLTNLKILNCKHNRNMDNNSINALTKIEILDICGTNISKISHLKNLKSLRCNIYNKISDSEIKDLTDIEELHAFGCEITSVNHLKNLKELSCSSSMNNNGISKLLHIEKLRIHNNNKIKNISHLTQLKVLHIDGCCVLINDIEIKNLTNLEYFAMNNTITKIGHLTKLKYLYPNNNITNDEIKTLVNLEYIDLQNNDKITDVSCLKKLKELIYTTNNSVKYDNANVISVDRQNEITVVNFKS